MKNILNNLFEHKRLTKEQAATILTDIAMGKYNEQQVASFITVFAVRGIEPAELAGFVSAMQALCVTVDLDGHQTIDMCGTGGDGKDTFNVSTLASFIIAGAGVRVAKHGNYGLSSNCGSSTVLESMGHKFSSNQGDLRRDLDKSGICFMHAPLFHPAMKFVGPIRKSLGFKTFFNMLGPLINPSSPAMQSVGVFNLEVARLYKYVLDESGIRFNIIHSLDGYDEISLTGQFKLTTNTSERFLSPSDLGLQQVRPEEIRGGDTVAGSVDIFRRILENKGTRAQTDVVLANAASGLSCARPGVSLIDCVAEARESLVSGRANNALVTLLSLH